MTSTSVNSTPISTASSSPKTSPLTAVTTAPQNSTLLKRQNRISSDGWIRPITAIITMQPSVA